MIHKLKLFIKQKRLYLYAAVLLVFFPASLAGEDFLVPVEIPVRRDISKVRMTETDKGSAVTVVPVKNGKFRIYPICSGRVVRSGSGEISILHSDIPGVTIYSGFLPQHFRAGEYVSSGTVLGTSEKSITVINRVSPAARILKEQIHYRKPKIAVINPCKSETHLSMVTPVVKIIDNYIDADVRVIHYMRMKETPLPDFDALIITGQSTPWEDYDMSIFAPVKDVLEKGNVPVLGICGGHQLIALLNGTPVGLVRDGCDKTKGYDGCYKIRGPVSVEILEKDNIFYGQPDVREFFASHCEEIKGIPPGFICIARSGESPVYAIRHRTKFQYGIQFHPELGDIEGSEEVIRQFVFLAVNNTSN